MTTPPFPVLSVVIPAYNEEPRIAASVAAIDAFLESRPYPSEVIVVDDGSRDGTPRVLADLQKRHPRLTVLRNEPNRGKGGSVKRGVLAARGDYVLFTDADLPIPIEEVEALIGWLKQGFGVAIGSKRVPGATAVVDQPVYRRIMGRVFNRLVQWATVRGIYDTQCGFKCFARDAAHRLFAAQTLEGFCFDVEVLYLAQKWNIGIKEVPIRWSNRDASTSVGIVGDSLKMARDVLKIRWRDWRGRYDRP